MAPQKGHPLLASTKGAALSGMAGSRLRGTKPWGLIYVGAHSCWGRASSSPRAGQHLRGHSQACWDVVIWNQGCKEGPRMNTQHALPLGLTQLAASLQSGQASIPPSQKKSPPPHCPIRKGSLSHSLFPYSPSLVST